MPKFITVITRDAANTYSARCPGVFASSTGLSGKSASCTAGREQAIKALLLKAEPPLRLIRIHQEINRFREDGSRTGGMDHLVEVEEI